MTRRLENITVLIVDDDADIQSSIELAIRAEGATTVTADDGNEALAQYSTTLPQAVVLDMMLPRASGFVVLEKLAALDDPPVVVMVTANLGRRHQTYAKDLGVHAYLTKPVSLERLVDTLVDLLAQRDESS